VSPFCHAQKPSIDSLIRVTQSEAHDTIKYKVYLHLISYAANVEEAKAYFTTAQKLVDQPDQIYKQADLYNQLLRRICDIGKDSECQEFYEQMELFTIKNGQHTFQTSAKLTKSRREFEKGNLDLAKKYLEEIAVILENHDLPNSENAYWIERSFQARLKGDLELSLAYNSNALKALKNSKSDPLKCQTYASRARIFRFLGQIDSAEQTYLKTEKIFDKASKHLQASVYNNLGNINHIKGRYAKATDYYLKSIEIKEATNNIRGLAIGYHNIAAIKIDMQSYVEAIELFEKSEKILEKIDFRRMSVANQLKIALAYQGLENYEQSEIYHISALALSKELKIKRDEIRALTGLGLDRIKLGKLENAQTTLIRAVELAQSIKAKEEECAALIALAEWYVAASQNGFSKKQTLSYAEIEEMLLRAKVLSEEMDYGEKKILVYKGLNKLYDITGESKKHKTILQEYITLNDTLFQKSRTDAIAAMETKYKTSEKEKEIIQLESDNKIATLRTRIWQWLLGIMAVLFSVLGFFGYKYLKAQNARKRLEEAERFRTKLSSDLHDDVGTMLSSLTMQTEVMGLTASPEQVQKFDKITALSREAMGRMRDTVWAIDGRKDTVQSLVDRMNDFLQDRLNGHSLRTRFNRKIKEEQFKLQPEVRQNIYLIFKEAVTNAAKYSNGDLLSIDFQHDENELLLVVKDNGTLSAPLKKSGTGITNFKLRAERINAKLQINTSDGFEVRLQRQQ